MSCMSWKLKEIRRCRSYNSKPRLTKRHSSIELLKQKRRPRNQMPGEHKWYSTLRRRRPDGRWNMTMWWTSTESWRMSLQPLRGGRICSSRRTNGSKQNGKLAHKPWEVVVALNVVPQGQPWDLGLFQLLQNWLLVFPMLSTHRQAVYLQVVLAITAKGNTPAHWNQQKLVSPAIKKHQTRDNTQAAWIQACLVSNQTSWAWA